MLDCTKTPSSPCARNSSTQRLRAKKPRSSSWRCIFTSAAPATGSFSNNTSAPVEFRIDLPGRLQIQQLLQACEGAKLVGLRLHLNAFEKLAQLTRAVTCRVGTAKT